MPYFIFRLSSTRALTYVDQYGAYPEARDAARGMRAEQENEGEDQVKIVFADDRSEAEALLRQRRERQPSQDD